MQVYVCATPLGIQKMRMASVNFEIANGKSY